jgi:Arc/MetJ family transcription regulator
MHMRTTLIIEPDLLEEAMRASGLTSKSAAVRAGLECLIANAAAARLAALGGSLPSAVASPRRRPSADHPTDPVTYARPEATPDPRRAVVHERPTPRPRKPRRP